MKYFFDSSTQQVREQEVAAKLEEREKEMGKLVEALKLILDDEGSHCTRCDGNGKLWADGQAHYQSYTGATINCGECGGSGRIYPDIKEQIREALIQSTG